MQCDDMIATDHTHKFGNGIRASGRPGKVFTCSYMGVSGIGSLNFNVLAFTKENAELHAFSGSWSSVRENADAGPLKIHDTDNMGGDHSLFNNSATFKRDLQQGVVPYRPTGGSCVMAYTREACGAIRRDKCNYKDD
mmetsp:Transcript_32621/g.66023  ORF Transcript_32621/g.66023 Transcript_32621/m.66023 type:complete len:137 (-) Transcript_32621:177-587(-)